MEDISTIGLDLVKHVFQAHGADKGGAVIFRKKLRRQQVLSFFAALPRCIVAMEACPGSHYEITGKFCRAIAGLHWKGAQY